MTINMSFIVKDQKVDGGHQRQSKPFNAAFANTKATLERCKLPQKHKRTKEQEQEQEHCAPRGRGIQSNLCAKIALMNRTSTPRTTSRNSRRDSYEKDSLL